VEIGKPTMSQIGFIYSAVYIFKAYRKVLNYVEINMYGKLMTTKICEYIL